MKEGQIYIIGNEKYVCIKEISFVVFDFLESGLLGDFREINNYVLLRIKNNNEKEIKREIGYLEYYEIFKGSIIDPIIDFLKYAYRNKENIYIISGNENNFKPEVGNVKYSEYKSILEIILDDFIKNNEYSETELLNLFKSIENNIENNIGLLHTVGFLKNYENKIIKDRINQGIIAFSLKYGKNELKNWFVKQLDDYKMKKLINSI